MDVVMLYECCLGLTILDDRVLGLRVMGWPTWFTLLGRR